MTTVVEILAAAKALLAIAKLIVGKEKLKEWNARLAIFEKNAPSIGAAWSFFENIAEAVYGGARDRRAKAAIAANPALQKTAKVAGMLLLMAGLTLGVASCARSGGLTVHPATENTKAAYVYEWPQDASKDPAAYHTIEIDGHMETSTERLTP